MGLGPTLDEDSGTDAWLGRLEARVPQEEMEDEAVKRAKEMAVLGQLRPVVQ